MHENILDHKDKLPHSSLPCTKLGAGDSLIATEMVIMTNKEKSQFLFPAYPPLGLCLTYRSETMRSFEARKQTGCREMQTRSLAEELMKHN